MGKAGGYYAVQKGKQPGIYKTWAECEAQTKGFTGAVFKKFGSEAAATEFIKGNGYGATSSSSNGKSSPAGVRYQPYAKSAPKRDDKQGSNNPSKKREGGSSTESGPALRSFVNPIFPTSGTSSGRKAIVFCDGSSIGNGKTSARAGWGVYFENSELHHLNESRRLPGEPQTNNRAELMALIRAIQLCPNDGRELHIHTDSQYSMDCVEKWLPNWRQRDWKTATGKDVLNKDLIMQLDEKLRSRRPHPKLIKVKAHSGIEGNEIVDRMAKFGASLPKVDSADLSKRSAAPESHIGLGATGHAASTDSTGSTINASTTPTRSSGVSHSLSG